MIEMRRRQLSFGDGLIAQEISYLRESWMIHADAVLADEDVVAAVYEALAKRHPKSRCRGRRGAPAEMVLRLLVLKHIRNWSYQVLEREVRANLVYRDFTRVGGGKMPDAKTMGRWGVALGPEVLKREAKAAEERTPDGPTGQRSGIEPTVAKPDAKLAPGRQIPGIAPIDRIGTVTTSSGMGNYTPRRLDQDEIAGL